MTRVGVVLSGCGYLDGSEIHETVLTLLCLDRAGVEAVCVAPDVVQRRVSNHRTGADCVESRNALVEAARIARGKIRPLAELDASDIDALILPGGFGAALNLSSFGVDGARGTVIGDLVNLLRATHAAAKPIGAICIAPAILAMVFGSERPELTIGDDSGTAAALETLGAVHRECPVTGFHVDEALRLVTTPAYMYDARLADVERGLSQLVDAVLGLIPR